MTLVRKATDRAGKGTSRAAFGAYVYRGANANQRCVVVELTAAGNKAARGHSSTSTVDLLVDGDAIAPTGETYTDLGSDGFGISSGSGGTGGLDPVARVEAHRVTLSEQGRLDPMLAAFLPIVLKPLADIEFTFTRTSVEVEATYDATTTTKVKPVKPAVAAAARDKEVRRARATRAASTSAAAAERDALLTEAATQTGLLAEWTTFYAEAGYLTSVDEAKGSYRAAVALAKRRERLALKGTRIVQLHDHEFAATLPLA